MASHADAAPADNLAITTSTTSYGEPSREPEYTGQAATKEPVGLIRADGKRPDGITLVPWREGRSITWDVTIADTVADSYLAATSTAAGAAAEAAAVRKTFKYAALMQLNLFASLAIETFGPICTQGQSFIRDIIGKRISAATSDPREAACLFQRLSIAVLQYNAICFAGTFQSASEASHT